MTDVEKREKWKELTENAETSNWLTEAYTDRQLRWIKFTGNIKFKLELLYVNIKKALA